MKSSTKIALALVALMGYAHADVLTLSEAYNLALANSKNIKASEYHLESNRQRIDQAKAELYPQVYLSGAYGKKEYGSNGFGKIANYGLSLNQSIYNPALNSKIDIETSKVALSSSEVELKKQELSQIVLPIYLNILKAQNKVELYNAYGFANERKLQLLQIKFDMALSNRMDLLQGEVDYHFSKMDLRKEKRLIRVNQLKLKHLLGTSDFQLPTIDFDRVTDETVRQMKEAITGGDPFLVNLKIEQAKMRLNLSSKEIKSASNGHLPNVSLNAQYAEIDADASVSSLENTKSLMLQIQIPLYQGGIVESRITASKLAYRAVQEELLQIEDEIKEEYDERLALFDSASSALRLYKEALNSAQLYLDSVSLAFDKGLKSSIDMNDAKNKLYEVKYRYVENIYEMISAYVGLLILTNSLENLEIVDSIITQKSFQ